jgi:hypothetical protein
LFFYSLDVFFSTSKLSDSYIISLNVLPSVRPSVCPFVHSAVHPSYHLLVCFSSQSVCPSTHLFIRSSVHILGHLYICLFFKSVCLSIYPSFRLLICPYIRSSIHLPVFQVSLSVHLSIITFTLLSIHLYICLFFRSVCLSIYPSFHLLICPYSSHLYVCLFFYLSVHSSICP